MIKKSLFIGPIAIYRSLIPNCERIIEKLEWSEKQEGAAKWERARCYDGSVLGKEDNSRTNSFLNLTSGSYSNEISDNLAVAVQQEINDHLYKHFHNALNDYKCRFGVSLSDETNRSMQILKYGQDQKFEPHADDGVGTPRRVSALAYLNDNFSGGELEFTFSGILYNPSVGDLVLFPSSYFYVHGARPVTDGTKYSAVTWWF